MGHKILELAIWFAVFGLVVVGASTVLSLGAAKIRNRGQSKYRPKTPHL